MERPRARTSPRTRAHHDPFADGFPRCAAGAARRLFANARNVRHSSHGPNATFGQVWLSDPAIYPLWVSLGAAFTALGYFGTKALRHPEVAFSRHYGSNVEHSQQLDLEQSVWQIRHHHSAEEDVVNEHARVMAERHQALKKKGVSKWD
jgi:hypothetical protein